MACREELSRSHSRGNKTMSKEIVHDPQAISKQILELGSNLPECKPHIWRGSIGPFKSRYRWDMITGMA